MKSKSELRAQRLLAQMDGKSCTLEPVQNGSVVLVRIEGFRTIKCAPELMAHLVSSGAVILSGDIAEVSDAGRGSLKRGAAARQPFRAQHDAIVLKRCSDSKQDASAIGDVWITDESPLARLAKLKAACGQSYLSKPELDAGERLRRDFESGMMQPRVTASLEPTRVAGKRSQDRNHACDLTDTAIGARERVANALDRLEPELAGIAVDICCFLKGLETVETERGWPRRSAKLMLKTALGGLARYYFPVAKARRSTSKELHWGAQDYRPALR